MVDFDRVLSKDLGGTDQALTKYVSEKLFNILHHCYYILKRRLQMSKKVTPQLRAITTAQNTYSKDKVSYTLATIYHKPANKQIYFVCAIANP